jgi:hypothetical protein
MTDDREENTSRTWQSSIGIPPTISEDPSSNSTISALVTNTPLLDQSAATVLPNGNTPRPRRRSSVSILQALVNSSHSLPTPDARRR